MNLAVRFSSPLWFASGYDRTLHSELGSYSQTTRAIGGYWSWPGTQGG